MKRTPRDSGRGTPLIIGAIVAALLGWVLRSMGNSAAEASEYGQGGQTELALGLVLIVGAIIVGLVGVFRLLNAAERRAKKD